MSRFERKLLVASCPHCTLYIHIYICRFSPRGIGKAGNLPRKSTGGRSRWKTPVTPFYRDRQDRVRTGFFCGFRGGEGTVSSFSDIVSVPREYRHPSGSSAYICQVIMGRKKNFNLFFSPQNGIKTVFFKTFYLAEKYNFKIIINTFIRV